MILSEYQLRLAGINRFRQLNEAGGNKEYVYITGFDKESIIDIFKRYIKVDESKFTDEVCQEFTDSFWGSAEDYFEEERGDQPAVYALGVIEDKIKLNESFSSNGYQLNEAMVVNPEDSTEYNYELKLTKDEIISMVGLTIEEDSDFEGLVIDEKKFNDAVCKAYTKEYFDRVDDGLWGADLDDVIASRIVNDMEDEVIKTKTKSDLDGEELNRALKRELVDEATKVTKAVDAITNNFTVKQSDWPNENQIWFSHKSGRDFRIRTSHTYEAEVLGEIKYSMLWLAVSGNWPTLYYGYDYNELMSVFDMPPKQAITELAGENMDKETDKKKERYDALPDSW